MPGGGRVHSLASCMQTSDYLKFNSAYFSVNISCPKEKNIPVLLLDFIPDNSDSKKHYYSEISDQCSRFFTEEKEKFAVGTN